MSEKNQIIVAPLMPTRGHPHYQAEHSLRLASIVASKAGIQVFHVRHRTSSAVHENRNAMIADLIEDCVRLKQKFTHILFQDDDIAIPEEAIVKLVEADKPIVGALCTTRGNPPIPNARIFYEETGLWENIFDYEGLDKVGAVGTGLMLIDYEKVIKPMAMIYLDCLFERDVFGMSEKQAEEWSRNRKAAFNQRPNAWWFRWMPPTDGVDENSEDIFFCWTAKRYFEIDTWVESRVQPGHIGEWPFSIADYEKRREEAIALAIKEGRYHPKPEQKGSPIMPRVFVAMADAAHGNPVDVPLVKQEGKRTTGKISVLIPSRNRSDVLDKSIWSLVSRVAGENPWRKIEILVRFDEDDKEPIKHLTKNWGDVPVSFTIGPRHGYRNLHLYYNELAEKATGDWLMQWNDDAIMETEGWDQKIHAQGSGLKVLNATGRLNLFPIISRELYEVLGHWSLQAHSDSWLQTIGRMNGIEYPVDLQIRHLRDEGLEDQTKKESLKTYSVTSPEFFSRPMQEKLRRDVRKVHKAVERLQKQALKQKFSGSGEGKGELGKLEQEALNRDGGWESSVPVNRYDFDTQKAAWASPPIDDFGYFSSEKLLRLSDTQLKKLIEKMTETRYGLDGWRNYQNKWRDCLRLDSTKGKRILDFGSGVGLEALQFAQNGNRVWLADIVPSNLELAQRVLQLYGYKSEGCLSVTDSWPFLECDPVDIFYANGVLHHIPYAQEIMRRVVELLTPDGRVHLMLYSDRGWQKYAGKLPAMDAPVENDPLFSRFVRAFDAVGNYADWYNREKLEWKFGEWFQVEHCDYITPDDRYLVAILKPQPDATESIVSSASLEA